MAGELDNMKRLHQAKVRKIEINADTLILEVRYDVVSEDGDVMYSEGFGRDMSKVENIGGYTIAQLQGWATNQAAAHARRKYGRKNQ